MTKYLKCKKEECKEEWVKWKGDEDQENAKKEEAKGYNALASLDYILTHCESKGCHNIYYRGKNGWDCDYCGKKLCEICSSDKRKMKITKHEEHFCRKCWRTIKYK